MSMLGDVVFCVDCDIARKARMDEMDESDAGPALALDGPPRRMATKRDANGDPLCVTCLDARQASRRSEFMLHQVRAPIAGAGNRSADLSRDAESTSALTPKPMPASATSSKSGFIRIMRSRTPVAEANGRLRKKRKRQPGSLESSGRRVERQFGLLALEMGFLRAHQLLEGLKVRVHEVAATATRRGTRPEGVSGRTSRD